MFLLHISLFFLCKQGQSLQQQATDPFSDADSDASSTLPAEHVRATTHPELRLQSDTTMDSGAQLSCIYMSIYISHHKNTSVRSLNVLA
jgi:hypothetical protein